MTRDNSRNDDPQRSPEFERVISRVRDQLTSRRGFMAGSAALGVGALGVTGLAQADEHDDEDGRGNSNNGRGNRNPFSEEGTDVDVLNYALTLEHLEDAFYRDNTPSRETMLSARGLQAFPEEILNEVYDYIVVIGEHEATHVEVLSTVIRTLGGEPVQAADYDFGVDVRSSNEDGVAEFLAVAQALENTGVMAYAGALDLIESPDLQTAAATVATVEARHASFLNLLNLESPFPEAFDEAKSMDEILDVAGQFIV